MDMGNHGLQNVNGCCGTFCQAKRIICRYWLLLVSRLLEIGYLVNDVLNGLLPMLILLIRTPDGEIIDI